MRLKDVTWLETGDVGTETVYEYRATAFGYLCILFWGEDLLF